MHESGSQSKTMLIPVDKLNLSRKSEFNDLKNYSEKTSENTYLFKIKWKQCFKNCSSQADHPILQFCNQMCVYAFGMSEELYFKDGDSEWYNFSHINFLKGFDHHKNFNNAMKMTIIDNIPIKIIEGYLILDDYTDIDYSL